MSSPTNKTRNIRRAKKMSIGKKQKNKIRREGSTPRLLKLDKPVRQ